jgi:hypothetical protein
MRHALLAVLLLLPACGDSGSAAAPPSPAASGPAAETPAEIDAVVRARLAEGLVPPTTPLFAGEPVRVDEPEGEKTPPGLFLVWFRACYVGMPVADLDTVRIDADGGAFVVRTQTAAASLEVADATPRPSQRDAAAARMFAVDGPALAEVAAALGPAGRARLERAAASVAADFDGPQALRMKALKGVRPRGPEPTIEELVRFRVLAAERRRMLGSSDAAGARHVISGPMEGIVTGEGARTVMRLWGPNGLDIALTFGPGTNGAPHDPALPDAVLSTIRPYDPWHDQSIVKPEDDARLRALDAVSHFHVAPTPEKASLLVRAAAELKTPPGPSFEAALGPWSADLMTTRAAALPPDEPPRTR